MYGGHLSKIRAHMPRWPPCSSSKGEAVHVLHPNQIVAFQGMPEQREDALMKLPSMYRKKRLDPITGEWSMAINDGAARRL